MLFRGYDVFEESGRLVVTRSKVSALLDVAAVIVLFALGAPGLVWAISVLEPGRMTAILILLLVVAAGVSAFLVVTRAYGGNRLAERLVLDGAADAVVRAGVRVCAMSELDRVELRRREGDEGPDVFAVVLAITGLRPRGAPAGSSAFEDAIPVAQSTSEAEMRACASRVAGHAGVRVEEIGW